MPISFTNAGPRTAVNPPTMPIKNAADAYGTNPIRYDFVFVFSIISVWLEANPRTSLCFFYLTCAVEGLSLVLLFGYCLDIIRRFVLTFY